MALRPETIADAQAIDGVTPAAVLLLLSIIRRGKLDKAAMTASVLDRAMGRTGFRGPPKKSLRIL